MESRIREQDALLAFAQQLGGMGPWKLLVPSGRLEWPDATCELFGLAPSQFGGTLESFLDRVVPEDRPAVREAHAQAAPDAPGFELAYRIRRGDGAVRWMHDRGTTQFDAAGRPVARIGMVRDVTEQRTAREAHERDVSLLRIASRVSLLGGWTIDLPRRKLTWSDENCAIHDAPPGYEPELHDGIGLFFEEHREEVARMVEACARDGTPYEFELPKRTLAGRRIWVRCIGEAVRDADGSINRIQGAIQDVTARREADEALRQKVTLLRIAGRMARIGGWAIEVPSGDLAWSEEIWGILGLQPGDQPPLDAAMKLYSPEWREKLGAAIAACMDKGTPFDMEAEITDAAGRRMPVRVAAQAARDAEGRVVRIEGAFQDLTPLRHAERAARENEERFLILSHASNDAIRDWDLASGRLWWNEGFETLFGFRRDEVEPGIESWARRIHPDERERIEAELREALDSRRGGWSGSYRFARADGGYARVQDRCRFIRDSGGEAIRMVAAMTDVTERLALEEQLRQSQRLDSIGQLSGGVAHDFNNLLTVILGGAEILIEDLAGNADLLPVAQMISKAATRGADLTQRLLAFARRQMLAPRAVEVNGLLAEFDSILRRTLGAHIEIETARTPGLWHALVDPAQLESALLNLAINARDAMPEGGRLTLATGNSRLDADFAARHAPLTAGDYVMISVADDGCGIEPEHLGRVFEPFFTTKQRGKGTGLGLAMVYGFVKQSGGHVSLDSHPGRGTTVTIYLPRAEQPVAAPRDSPRALDMSPASETILLVEDEDLVRDSARRHLVELGYSVREAANAIQALEILRAGESVDLLFTDVVMPGMGGRDLAEAARGMRPALKVLYTSGYTEDAIVHQGRLDPGVQLLRKPYHRAELARSVRAALAADRA